MLKLQEAWDSVLGEGTSQSLESFFKAGGDSLKLVDLWTTIEEFYDGTLDVDAFMARPTLATLVELVSAQRNGNIESDDSHNAKLELSAYDFAPLSGEIYRKYLQILKHWPGEQCSRDGLVRSLGYGPLPPIFLITQYGEELKCAADFFAGDRLVFGMRSGHEILPASYSSINELSEIYARNIAELHPAGPIFLVGNCQGGIVASSVSQKLKGLGRECPVLILFEWHFQAPPYSGDCFLIYGSESPYCPKTPETYEPDIFTKPSLIYLPAGHSMFNHNDMRKAASTISFVTSLYS